MVKNEYLTTVNDFRFFDSFNIEKKTVCVLAIDDLNLLDSFNDIIRKLIKDGCKAFVICGLATNKVESLVDDIIEDMEMYDVVTTSHLRESYSDIADFIINCVYPFEKDMKILIFSFAKGSNKIEENIKKIYKESHQ